MEVEKSDIVRFAPREEHSFIETLAVKTIVMLLLYFVP